MKVKSSFPIFYVGLVCQNSNTVSQFKRLVVVMLLFKLQGRNNLSKANKFSYIAVLYLVSAASENKNEKFSNSIMSDWPGL